MLLGSCDLDSELPVEECPAECESPEGLTPWQNSVIVSPSALAAAARLENATDPPVPVLLVDVPVLLDVPAPLDAKYAVHSPYLALPEADGPTALP
jgi:hypothetical protein